MKNFVIETNQNYLKVMNRILSDCDVSGFMPPELENFRDKSNGKNKLYDCFFSGDKLVVKMKMPYRNSFASTMRLKILSVDNKTVINGSTTSIMSSKLLKKMFGICILLFSIYWLIQPFIFSYSDFQPIDWIYILVGALLLLSSIPLIFDGKKKNDRDISGEPYGVQMENWISNLFPGEYKILEK